MMERELGMVIFHKEKTVFVCGSYLLIKDCDYYEKKIAREAEFKKQRVFNIGNMVAKPVWTNDDRINHANQFVPRPVQLNADLDSQYLPGPQTALVLKDHRYALTTNPTIHDSLVKQFWQTATAKTLADGTLELHATIDTIVYTITEASIRNKLQLADASGITMLPNNEIFEGMGHMGYPTDGSFTFWKSFFTPQWRFLVHHILHCISSKSGGWDQFGSNIATALICLSTGRVYNFSKLIFDGMVANLKSKTKFLMYPRFLQMILDIQTENKHPYLAVTLTKKIFGNMKRGFRGVPRPLLPAMLSIANPSAGQEAPSVTQPQPSSSVIDDLEKQLKETKQTFGKAILTLVERVKSLEVALKRKTKRVLLSDSEEEETKAQGRKTHDLDPLVSLVQELVTPSKTVNASEEEQVEDISPTTLEAAAILTKVKKIKSVDKGKRYKRFS
ncbi:hypothetical protein Tco_0576429 [Tanacetum coccineum]